MAHGDAREGKWRGNWRMEWVASTLTRPRKVVYPALLTLMRTPRLPAVDWTDSPADLNELVRLGERRNVVSARVPSGSARALLKLGCWRNEMGKKWKYHKWDFYDTYLIGSTKLDWERNQSVWDKVGVQNVLEIQQRQHGGSNNSRG